MNDTVGWPLQEGQMTGNQALVTVTTEKSDQLNQSRDREKLNDGYHEQLHPDILAYIARPMLIVVSYHTVIIVVVSVLQSKHEHRLSR